MVDNRVTNIEGEVGYEWIILIKYIICVTRANKITDFIKILQ